MNADAALNELIWGNIRYMRDYTSADTGSQRRREVAAGQHPFAAILSCSDSRVPPETIFDQGLGDLFVVRTAGQAVDDIVIGSIEYAVEYLGVRLIVVLGHQDCGAVTAAFSPTLPPGAIAAVTDAIQPAAEASKSQCGDPTANAIIDNIFLGVGRLAASPLLYKARSRGLLIVGALYCLNDGRVVFL